MLINRLLSLKNSFILLIHLSFGVVFAQNGVLDTTFGTNGLISFTNNEDPEIFNAILELDNNQFLAAGTTGYNAVIARLNQDGSLDATFGTNGILELDFGGTREDIEDMLQLPDGKILITAETKNANDDYDFIVAKLHDDGSYDTTFGTNGVTVITFGATTDERPNKIITTTDNKIVVVGNAEGGLIWQTAIAQLLPDGSLDTSFNDDGKNTLSITNRSDYLIGADITFDGKIMAAGGAVFYAGSNQGRYAIVRYLNNGLLDPTFGTNGVVTLNIFDGSCIARSIICLSDGKSLVAGHASATSTQRSFAIIRINSDGTIDPTFGDNGIVSTVFPTDQSQIYEMKLDENNNIIVVGDVGTDTEASNFAIAKYSFDGAIDTTFGTNGTISTDFFGSHDTARDFIITQNKITVVGYAMDPYPNENFAIARYDVESSLGVIDNDFKNNFEVLPTVVSSNITIKSNLQSRNVDVSIVDINGKVVYHKTLILNQSPKSINLETLAKGLYVLKIKSDSQIETHKIILK